jgi:hypothetical protein
MLGDYISTSLLAGQQVAVPSFAVGLAPLGIEAFDEPIFAAIEKVRSGTHRTANDAVQFSTVAAEIPAPTTL